MDELPDVGRTGDLGLDLVLADGLAALQLELRGRRQELMHRWIEQPDRHRQSGHRAKDILEVLALDRSRRTSAACRSSAVSARIMSWTIGSRLMSFNIRSVRHRPMPTAP